MTRSRLSAPILVAVSVFVLLMAWSSTASAQRYGHVHGPGGRSVVFVGGGFGYPGFFWGPWYPYPWRPYGFGPYGPYGPYGPSGPYGPYGWYGPYDAFSAAIRLEVTPREAEVFVDGYAAGTVDDFDGTFQRLRLSPGVHEFTIFLNVYRTIREERNLRP